MTWIFNELSAQGLFNSAENALDGFSEILQLRNSNKLIRQQFLSTRQLQSISVAGTPLYKAVAKSRPLPLKTLLLAWLSKHGPFWEDARADNPDDYFEFEDEDVTNGGLGEVARRRIVGQCCYAFSFPGVNERFARTPLEVVHGLPQNPISTIQTPNIWSLEELKRTAEQLIPSPENWKEYVDTLSDRFRYLSFSEEILSQLQAEPFSLQLTERINRLLSILAKYVDSRENGRDTDESRSIRNDYFVGERALFSDESDRNKHNFAKELSFRDPQAPGGRIFCPFHGKISSPKFRIHFVWPLPAGKESIYVAYIAPKITKR